MKQALKLSEPYLRRVLGVVAQRYLRLDEILRTAVVDVDHLLRIAVEEREP